MERVSCLSYDGDRYNSTGKYPHMDVHKIWGWGGKACLNNLTRTSQRVRASSLFTHQRVLQSTQNDKTYVGSGIVEGAGLFEVQQRVELRWHYTQA